MEVTPDHCPRCSLPLWMCALGPSRMRVSEWGQHSFMLPASLGHPTMCSQPQLSQEIRKVSSERPLVLLKCESSPVSTARWQRTQ